MLKQTYRNLQQTTVRNQIVSRNLVAHRTSQYILGQWLPLHRFGASVFNTPLLLVLRLFYQASPFDLSRPQAGHSHSRIHSGENQYHANDCTITTSVDPLLYQLNHRHQSSNLFRPYEKLTTSDWLTKLSTTTSVYENCQVVSITWVKALASPLSHEFIQFVVEDVKHGTRTRIVADRYEDGDWVFVGWDWAAGQDLSDRHSLPLPLVSLIFNDASSRPSLFSMASVLADVTGRRPGYNILKEMCWWYAEAIFETMHTKFGGHVKEWEWAKYRYSFIVRTSVLRRQKLVAQAQDFMAQNMREMTY